MLGTENKEKVEEKERSEEEGRSFARQPAL